MSERIRDYQCYINFEPWTCSKCGGHTLKSLTTDHQASGSDYCYWVVAQDVDVEDGGISVATYDKILDDDEVPPAEDGDGSWWEDHELRCAWCDKEVSCDEDESDDD
jgi:hypothetical protein